jgi:hypothetical protein
MQSSKLRSRLIRRCYHGRRSTARMDQTITTGELARLFDTTPKTIAALGQKGIIVPADKLPTAEVEALWTR